MMRCGASHGASHLESELGRLYAHRVEVSTIADRCGSVSAGARLGLSARPADASLESEL
jgi:hypothetical protein